MIITGLNTILPLMNDEILKVHVHVYEERPGRERKEGEIVRREEIRARGRREVEEREGEAVC